MGPRQALDLGADAHTLARRHHRADPGHQALLLAVLEERAEQLGRAADHRLGIADDDEQLLGAGDGDVDPVGVVQEADRGAVVGAHERKNHSIRLPSFERVDRLDVVWRDDAFERALQPVDLRVVHRYHGEVGLAHAPADDRRDVLAERDLELVRHRPLSIAVLVLRPGVDPHQLAVEGPGQRHPRMRRLVDELASVKEVRDDAADRFSHAVLARQHDLRAGRHLVPDPAVEAVVADDLIERLLDLEGRRRLLHHGGQLVEVADHDPALGERHQRERLVGADLVGLVEDQPVEHLESQSRVDGQAVASAGHQVVRLEVVSLDERRPDAARHLAGLGDARLAHVREAQQPLLPCVDSVVGVRRQEDRGARVATEDAADRLDDGRRLARARRSLDQVELARTHAHDAGDGLRLLLVGVRKVMGLLAVERDARGAAQPSRVRQLGRERTGARAADLQLADHRTLRLEHLHAGGRKHDALVRQRVVPAKAHPEVGALDSLERHAAVFGEAG